MVVFIIEISIFKFEYYKTQSSNINFDIHYMNNIHTYAYIYIYIYIVNTLKNTHMSL